MLIEDDVVEATQRAQEVLIDLVRDYFLQNFDTEGFGADNPYAQLAPSTIRRRGSAHPILRVTGQLRDTVAQTEADVYLNQHGMELFFMPKGPRQQIAWYHQTGTRNMPARPPLQLSEEQTTDVCEAFGEAIVEELRRMGYKVTQKPEVGVTWG